MRIQSYCAEPVSVETRADGSKVIHGYASVFYNPNDPGTEFTLGRTLKERVARDAFARALSEQHDVRALFNHDPTMILGRSKNGTVKLITDDRGLRYEINPPDTQIGRDVVTLLERGDVTGSSFAFEAKVTAFEKGKEYDVRWIKDVTLYDVGPVTYPAYESATSCIRSISDSDIAQEYAAWQMQVKMRERRLRVLRMIDLDKKGLT